MTAARLDSVSRAAISCNNTSTPWSAETGVNGIEYDDGKLHHMVSTLTNDSIKLYIDGALTGAKHLDTNNTISRISTAFAYIADVTKPIWPRAVIRGMRNGSAGFMSSMFTIRRLIQHWFIFSSRKVFIRCQAMIQ